MEKDKWNYRLIAVVWGMYWLFFIVYLFYSRTPDYFIGKRTEGEVIGVYDKRISAGKSWAYRECPIVYYYVDSVQYQFYSDKESYLGLYKKGDRVTMIYDPYHPEEACILGLIGYWINITEIITAFFLIAIITLFITVMPDGYDDKFTRALTKR